MTNHPEDDERPALFTESSVDPIDDPADAPAQPDGDPGLPASGIWLAVLLRDDTPLMRCGF